jgi:GNAT superfamily N-acetyltransferase
MAQFPLGNAVVVGRGGIELELLVSDGLSPQAAAWFNEHWHAYSLASYGSDWVADRPFAIVARYGGAIAGIASGESQGKVLVCSRLIVDESLRALGIGSQLIRHLERLALERGCTSIRLTTQLDGMAETFYSNRGFVRVTRLPNWREGRDFIVLVRDLPPVQPPH